MSVTTVTTFNKTLQKTNTWLRELMETLEWQDQHRAYHALRAVLHALRDRLSIEEVTDLAAQLPMLVRGFYYEGWKPSGKPLLERKKEQFLAHVEEAFRNDWEVDAEEVTCAVFKLLTDHLSKGEIDDVISNLPAELRALWP